MIIPLIAVVGLLCEKRAETFFIMTSRYRVEYALKSHKRDEFIEWIKSLLAVPFVLYTDIENYHEVLSAYYKNPEKGDKYAEVHEQYLAKTCQDRYVEVFHDVEKLIDSTRYLDELEPEDSDSLAKSRLRQLVPTVGRFFTRLPLKEAFLIEDEIRCISRRRLVSPSFNDVRAILNTAQVLALTSRAKGSSTVKLVTFDGDVTLYDDGKNLTSDSPLLGKLIDLLSRDICVAVVTAAGYHGQSGADEYFKRLPGLIEELRSTDKLTHQQKENFLVMGGESNYLYRFNCAAGKLQFIEGEEWYLPIMRSWSGDMIVKVMDACYDHLSHLQKKFRLNDPKKTTIIRKERSLGIIPVNGYSILRETLEEIVLSLLSRLHDLINNKDTQDRIKEAGYSKDDLRACAFNGGSDVWVDIGDKSLGVAALQEYLCKHKPDVSIHKSETLHIGDQFASVGANDFKARLSACTVWIASPKETEAILDTLLEYLGSNSANNAR